MPRRGIRIKINPRDRFDLSHLSTEDASQTLRHFLFDLCFWGNLLPAPTSTVAPRTPHYYHSESSEIPKAGLLRRQSSGSESRNSSTRSSSKQRSSQPTTNDRPPRNQPQTRWKTAVDASSGQTYYYDPVTRQTQWEKVRLFIPYSCNGDETAAADRQASVS